MIEACNIDNKQHVWNISRRVWGPSSKSTAGMSWVLLGSNSILLYTVAHMCVLHRQFCAFVKGEKFLLGLKTDILGLWIWIWKCDLHFHCSGVFGAVYRFSWGSMEVGCWFCSPPGGFNVYIQIAFVTLVQPSEIENQISPHLGFQSKFTQS